MEDHRRSGDRDLSSSEKLRRVVVTGLGVVSPLGVRPLESFEKLLRQESAANTIKAFPPEALPIQIACEVDASFDPIKRFGKRHSDQMDRFSHFACAASLDAWEDAKAQNAYQKERVAVVMASGLGGVLSFLQAAETMREHGARRVSPFTIPKVLPSIGAGWVSILLNLRGPNLSPATACAAGSHAIIQGFELIQRGQADAALVGGAEAPICAVGVAAFASMRALSASACRPFDLNRDGFVLGEGAAALFLEERKSALSRKATVYAEIVGFGQSGDGFHLTAPSEDGEGCQRAMQEALQMAGISPEKVSYLNAHATGTKAGDLAEAKAIESLFGQGAWVSSTKGATGHLLGAAGALEAVFTILALTRGITPPNVNLSEPDPACMIRLAATPQTIEGEYALSNSMGFGGTNASLLFRLMDNT